MSDTDYKLVTSEEVIYRYNEDAELIEIVRRWRDGDGRLVKSSVETVYLPDELGNIAGVPFVKKFAKREGSA